MASLVLRLLSIHGSPPTSTDRGPSSSYLSYGESGSHIDIEARSIIRFAKGPGGPVRTR